jgi:hypothetical protein
MKKYLFRRWQQPSLRLSRYQQKPLAISKRCRHRYRLHAKPKHQEVFRHPLHQAA